MDCNLRCWYCFESHLKYSIINPDVFSSISNLIENKVVKEKIKELNISLFGGEPFMVFDSIVMPLIRHANKQCKEHGCKLHMSFVTNGTLITRRKLNALMSLETEKAICFQITLDGNEYYHNKAKAFSNGKGSYKLIIENLKLILSCRMDVILRFNMTTENMGSFYDVVPELDIFTESEKEHIVIDFQRIWQDGAICEREHFLTMQADLRKAFLSHGFKVNELKHIDNSRCYADRENNVTVNYDGKLFNCTARDFKDANCEGQLLSDGSFLWNDRYKKRMAVKYGNAFCRQCKIFPLCHGGCSQYKLDCEQTDGCIRGYDEMYIKKIVEDRVDFLLERITNSYK